MVNFCVLLDYLISMSIAAVCHRARILEEHCFIGLNLWYCCPLKPDAITFFVSLGEFLEILDQDPAPAVPWIGSMLPLSWKLQLPSQVLGVQYSCPLLGSPGS